jgi:hypothetical protein
MIDVPTSKMASAKQEAKADPVPYTLPQMLEGIWTTKALAAGRGRVASSTQAMKVALTAAKRPGGLPEFMGSLPKSVTPGNAA